MSELRLNSMGDLLLLAYSPRPKEECQCHKSTEDCYRPYQDKWDLEKRYLEQIEGNLRDLGTQANDLRWERTLIISQVLGELAAAAIFAAEGIGTLRAIVSVWELEAIDWARVFGLATTLGTAGLSVSRIPSIDRELDEIADRAATLQSEMKTSLTTSERVKSEMIVRCFPLRPTGFGPGSRIEDLIDDWTWG